MPCTDTHYDDYKQRGVRESTCQAYGNPAAHIAYKYKIAFFIHYPCACRNQITFNSEFSVITTTILIIVNKRITVISATGQSKRRVTKPPANWVKV